MLINWFSLDNIDIYESPIDNTIFNEPSEVLMKLLTIHSKIITEICMQVGLMVILHQTRK